MARTRSATQAPGNGVPREVDAAPAGVPCGLAVAAAITWRVLLLAVAVVAVGYVAGKLLLVVVPMVVALLLSTLLVPLAHSLRDRGMHERAASLLVVVGAIALIAILLTLIVPPFVSHLSDLGSNVEKGSRKAGQVLRPLGVSQSQVDRAIANGVKSLKGGGGKKLAGGAVTGALAALNVLAALLLTFVLTFFFVKDGRQLWGWIVGLFGPRRRAGAEELGERVWHVLTGYVQGVALVAAIDATLIGIALVVVGVPLAMPLTVLTFFPVVGAVTVGAAAVLVAKGAVAAIIVAVVILCVQQLDGNVLQPVLVGRKLELHPVVVLLALAAGGVIAGLVGAFIAVPLAAVAGAVIDFSRTP
ncbi:MAG: AI-2E family transporter [Solirubrobacteraceae bacterium]